MFQAIDWDIRHKRERMQRFREEQVAHRFFGKETWKHMVERLKTNRAKGLCEICKQPKSLHGHHKVKPYSGGQTTEANCIICCDDCYYASNRLKDIIWEATVCV